MKQTKNALSMLLSAYRSIFKSAFFKGMATAVVLTTGLSAVVANAAGTDYNTREDLTVDSAVTVNTTTPTADPAKWVIYKDITINSAGNLTVDSVNSYGDDVTISGGTLTVKNGQLTDNYIDHHAGVGGTSTQGTFQVDNGTLNYENGGSSFANIAINNSNVTIGGGEAAADFTAWSQNSNLSAGFKYGEDSAGTFTIQSSQIALNNGSALNAEANTTLDIQNTDITLAGESGNFAKHSAILTAKAEGAVSIDANSSLTVKEGKYGAIYAPTINVAGAVNVESKANLYIDGWTTGSFTENDSHSASTVNLDNATLNNSGTITVGTAANGTTFTAANASINNAEGAVMQFYGDTDLEGSQVSNKGTMAVSGDFSVNTMSNLFSADSVEAENAATLKVSGDVTVIAQDEIDLTNKHFTQEATTSTLTAELSAVKIDAEYATKFDNITADKITTLSNAESFTLTGEINAIRGFDFQTVTAADEVAQGIMTLAEGDDALKTYVVSGAVSIGDAGVSGTQDYKFQVNGTNASLTTEGNWNIAEVEVTGTSDANGGLVINDGSTTIKTLTVTESNAKAVVNGDLAVTDSLKTSGASSVVVENGGNISLSDAVISIKDGAVSSGDGFNGITLNAGATAQLDLDGTLTADQVKSVLNTLTSNNANAMAGLVDLGDNVSVSGAAALVNKDGELLQSAVKAAGLNKVIVNDFEHASFVQDTADPINGSYGAVKTSGASIDLTGTLILNGADNAALDGDGNTLLVYQTVDEQNTASSVNFTDDGVLTLNADGVLDAITTASQGNGSVNVTAGHDVAVTSIGTSGKRINAVNVDDNSSLIVSGNDGTSFGIRASYLNVDGTLQAETADVLTAHINVTGDLIAGQVVDGKFEGTTLTIEKWDGEVTDAPTSYVKGGNVLAGTLIAKRDIEIGAVYDEGVSAVRSNVAIETLTVDTDATVSVQNGGVLAITDELPTSLAELNGVPTYGASSVLYLNKNNAINSLSGKLVVGDTIASAEKITIGNDSVTIFDGDTATAGVGTFINEGVSVVGSNAKLVLSGVSDGMTLATNVDFSGEAAKTDGYDSAVDGAWSGKNLYMTNGFLNVEQANTSLSVVKADDAVARARYNKLTDQEFAFFQDVALGQDNNDFVYDLMNDASVSSYDQQAKYFDSAARIALAGGVVQSSFLASKTTSDAIAQRTGVGATGNLATVSAQTAEGASVWLTPIYANSDSYSFDADHFEYGADIDLYGAALGVDYTNAQGFTAGVAMNVGSGDADSQGDLVSTSNDFDYFGLALYGSYEFGGFKLAADVGYTFLSSDIDQSNYSKLTTDTDSTVATFGLAGKYTFDLGVVDIAPHIGVRYLHLNVDDYDVNSADYGMLAHGDAITADIVQFPIGVTLSSEFAAGNWTVKPALDLSVIPATGDTDVDSDISFDGRQLSYNTDVMSDCSYGATVGVEAAYGNAAFGLGYSYFGSSDEDAQSFMLNARYTF